MLQSAIYDATANLTPSQREAAREHRKRMERIHGAAKVKPLAITFVPPPPVEQILPPIPNELMAQACSLVEEKKVVVQGEVTRIQKAVLAFFPDVTMNDLKSNRRTALVVQPRQLGMYLAKLLTARSLPDIGRRFGGRDHTTVLYAVRKYELLVQRDQVIAELVEKIKAVFAKDSSDD